MGYLGIRGFSLLAEAPASRRKRFARSAVDDMGHLSCPLAVQRAANTTHIKNAERDLHILFKDIGLTLPLRLCSKRCLLAHSWNCSSYFFDAFYIRLTSSRVALPQVWPHPHSLFEPEGLVSASSETVLSFPSWGVQPRTRLHQDGALADGLLGKLQEHLSRPRGVY